MSAAASGEPRRAGPSSALAAARAPARGGRAGARPPRSAVDEPGRAARRVVGRRARGSRAAPRGSRAKLAVAASAAALGEQQLDALLGRRVVRQQAQRARRTSARRSSGARCAAASPASRRSATAPRRLPRADCSTWCARAVAPAPRAASASALRSCAPSRQRAGRGLVDGTAHERMPEAEAPRHVGRADEVETQQLVERIERRGVARGRGRRRELGLERVAGHGRALEHAAARRRQQRELLGQRGGDHGGSPSSASATLAAGPRRRPRRSRARASCSR